MCDNCNQNPFYSSVSSVNAVLYMENDVLLIINFFLNNETRLILIIKY